MCGERDGDSSRRGARGQALPATPRTRRLPGCVHYGARIGDGPSTAPASRVGPDPTAVGGRRRIQQAGVSASRRSPGHRPRHDLGGGAHGRGCRRRAQRRAGRVGAPDRSRGHPRARAAPGPARRPGFHRPVRGGVHGHLPDARRAAAGHPGTEGERGGGRRAGGHQPGAGHRGRLPAGDGRQPGLRQAERPHRLTAGHAPAVDARRPGRREPRHPGGRVGTDHPGRSRRVVPGPALLQRAARRPGRGPPGPGTRLATRPGLRRPRRLPAHRLGDRHLSGPAVHRQPAGHVLAPCAFGGIFILLFAFTLDDRRLTAATKPAWSLRELASTFYVSPRKHPDFAWVFVSRFLFVLAYAFLTTYQAYYLLSQIGSVKADVPRQIFLGTLTQSLVLVAASLIAGRLSDRAGRRKIFVVTAATVYGLAMFMVAVASDFNGFLVGVAISGLGFGTYMAVDLALVADVLPGDAHAKDLGVLNIANALPFSVAPALAPAILAVGGGSYGLMYAVAGLCAVLAAGAILPVKRVR